MRCRIRRRNGGQRILLRRYYRMHIEGPLGIMVWMIKVAAQDLSVQQRSATGICETESEFGTCTSYNTHGECQAYNYHGERERRNENIVTTEQDQRGVCVQESSLGQCTEASRLGSCTEQPPYRMGVRHENPIGDCGGEEKRITECEGEWKANETLLVGNFNTENSYVGPFADAQHTDALLLKTVIPSRRLPTRARWLALRRAATPTRFITNSFRPTKWSHCWSRSTACKLLQTSKGTCISRAAGGSSA